MSSRSSGGSHFNLMIASGSMLCPKVLRGLRYEAAQHGRRRGHITRQQHTIGPGRHAPSAHNQIRLAEAAKIKSSDNVIIYGSAGLACMAMQLTAMVDALAGKR